MSQCDRILDYLERFGSISTMEAFQDLGITRLAARIAEIEHRGISIDRKFETAMNRFGQKVSFIRYSKTA